MSFYLKLNKYDKLTDNQKEILKENLGTSYDNFTATAKGLGFTQLELPELKNLVLMGSIDNSDNNAGNISNFSGVELVVEPERRHLNNTISNDNNDDDEGFDDFIDDCKECCIDTIKCKCWPIIIPYNVRKANMSMYLNNIGLGTRIAGLLWNGINFSYKISNGLCVLILAIFILIGSILLLVCIVYIYVLFSI